jgi:hypothetical protein
MLDTAGIGSRDFFNFMKNLDRSLDYDVVRTIPDDPHSWRCMSKKVHHRLVRLLLAQSLLLDLFIDTMRSIDARGFFYKCIGRTCLVRKTFS